MIRFSENRSASSQNATLHVEPDRLMAGLLRKGGPIEKGRMPVPLNLRGRKKRKASIVFHCNDLTNHTRWETIRAFFRTTHKKESGLHKPSHTLLADPLSDFLPQKKRSRCGDRLGRP